MTDYEEPDERLEYEEADELTPEDEALLDAIWDRMDKTLTNPILGDEPPWEQEDDSERRGTEGRI